MSASTCEDETPNERVTVPAVVGLDLSTAARRLAHNGLHMRPPLPSEEAARKAIVRAQDPAAGETAPFDGDVHVEAR